MKKGVLAVVAASFLYGIMPIFTKGALMEGMTSGSVVFYRLFFSAIVSFIMLKILGINMQASARQNFRNRNQKELCGRSSRRGHSA